MGKITAENFTQLPDEEGVINGRFVCLTCGAKVHPDFLNTHADWHQSLREVAEHIIELSRESSSFWVQMQAGKL